MLIDAMVQVVEARGPPLGDPRSLGIAQSRHAHMRKLRVQHDGRPQSSPVCLRSESILREYIRALGGELQLVAKFPDAEIKVHSFEPVH